LAAGGAATAWLAARLVGGRTHGQVARPAAPILHSRDRSPNFPTLALLTGLPACGRLGGMDRQPTHDTSATCRFVRLARETLLHPGGPRSLSSHVRLLRPAIAALRTDDVGWKWIAESLRLARGDGVRMGYVGTVRAAYSRAGASDAATVTLFSETQFRVQVEATMRNAVGTRTLSGHVRRLAPLIAAARADGIGWDWLAETVARARGRDGNLDAFAVQLRSLYHHLKPGASPAPSALPTTSATKTPVSAALATSHPATPLHVAAVVPPAQPAVPSARQPVDAGITARIRARNRTM